MMRSLWTAASGMVAQQTNLDTISNNLSNININERKREISTLKVLGFYNVEVDRYITSENLILTLIGIFLGLLSGYFLALKVIGTVEIEYVRFIYHIKP